jgi:hypothetical protein
MSAFPVVAPPPDGLRLAFDAARRRRTGKAAAGGTAALIAAVLVVASLGGAGNRTLLQEPVPPATGGNGPLPGLELPAPAATPSGRGTSVEEVQAVTARSLPHRNAVAIRSAAPAARAGEVRPTARLMSEPMTRASFFGYGNNDLTCPARKRQQGSRGLCTEVSSSSSSTGKTTLTANICNVDTADATMSYATARELDVAIVQAGEEVWRWSVGRTFAASPHELALPMGECLRWTTDWTQVDQSGRPVAKGTYRVVADFDAEELTDTDRHSTSSVTVS